MTEATDTAARLLAILSEIGARAVLDIGCGHGSLARALVRAGYEVTGIDPAPEAVAAARLAVPEARFEACGAEALPFAAASFEACVFLNSLHHVPVPLMQDALLEALRVLRPGGEVIIVEPLAEGAFFEVMRPVEDETEIRHAAIRAIDAVLADGVATGPAPVTYARPTPVADLDAFIAYLARVDSARRAQAEAQRATLGRFFAAHVSTGPQGPELIQPLRLWRLRAAKP
ncbi:MAG: class I SAM-dependent methyltransferase [Roseovarius sp.]